MKILLYLLFAFFLWFYAIGPSSGLVTAATFDSFGREAVQVGGSGVTAASNYIESNPVVNGSRIIPDNFSQNSRLIRSLNSHGDHFFYGQFIQGIPIYGVNLAVHIQNGNQVYGVSGNLVGSQSLESSSISDETARQTALTKARSDSPNGSTLSIAEASRFIINKKALGVSTDDVNHLTLAVSVTAQTSSIQFARKYFVDLSTNQIIYSENLVHDALTRKIYNCHSGTTNCTLERSEGQPAVTDGDTNKTYNILGDVYNFYFNTFQRNNYNNNPSTVDKALVHIASPTYCPNAAWTGAPSNQMQICNGMVANDVIGHEMTHALTQYTSNLNYSYQSGALNEAISDIFGFAIDPADWTMGEDTTIGVIRHMDDPTKDLTPHADRLFSSLYYCGTQDDGGVHQNSGIINKAFYLMTQGGNFNGCLVNGIGKEKAEALFYRAETVYLTSSSNFRDLYTVVNQSCKDLYQAASDTCIQVDKALKAVEIDQEPQGQQQGAKCLSLSRHAPQCGSGPTNTPSPSATYTPTPTLGQIPTPTLDPNCLCQSNNCSTACDFRKYSGVNYHNPIKCQRESSLIGPTPSSLEKRYYCNRSKRTKGDADGNGAINTNDYLYYVAAVNGGGIPSFVNTDFNGDGLVSSLDREIIIRNLQ